MSVKTKAEWEKLSSNLNFNNEAFINGKFVPENEAKISIYDSALMFGDMVFEMTRSFNQKQFKLDDHIERLLYGVKIFRIPLKFVSKVIYLFFLFYSIKVIVRLLSGNFL